MNHLFTNRIKRKEDVNKQTRIIEEIKKNSSLFIMIIPGLLLLLVFNYLPMFGVLIAFKNFKHLGSNFISSLFLSDWIGFKNFEYLFKTEDSFVITRNTLLYNFSFIVLGMFISVLIALMLNEIKSKKLAKLYQSMMFIPYFISWVVVSYLAYAFLSADHGFINRVIFNALGIKEVSWYTDTRPWPFILIFFNLWKWCGYNSIIYLAAIIAVDTDYYEAAMIDGASKLQQILKITLPSIIPIIIMMFLLNIGRIFYSDFGLFYQVPRNTGMLYPVTNVIDTYVYNGLMRMGDIGMSSAAGLYQSIVGFVLVLTANLIVRKIDKDYSLF